MSVIPEHINSREEAYGWLVRHGYSVDMANEELKSWEAPEVATEPAAPAEPVAAVKEAPVVKEVAVKETVEEAKEEVKEESKESSAVLGIFKNKKKK